MKSHGYYPGSGIRPQKRAGGIGLLLLLLLFLFGGALGVLWFLGSQAENRLNKNLHDGMTAVEKDRGEEAFNAFSKGRSEMGAPLKVFRTLSGLTGKTFRPPEEIDTMAVSALLMKIHSDLFDLKSVDSWIVKAEERFKGVSGTEANDIGKLVETAKELSNLVTLFENRNYEGVMKGLLVAEKHALPTDQDFFIMEVRLLIACGKGMKDQRILGHARELLFFISFEAGIKSPKVDRLWGLLNR